MRKLLGISLFVMLLFFAATSTFSQELGRFPFSQVLYFDNNGLTGQSDVRAYDSNRSTTFTFGMKNMVLHNDIIYQVYISNFEGESNVYLKKSPDGINWSERVLVSDDTSGSSQSYASIAVGGAGPDLCVVWGDGRDEQQQLRASVSIDGGQSFEKSVQISDHTDSDIIISAVTRDSLGVYYVSWNRQNSSGGYYTTWYSKSSDFGVSWLPKKDVYTSRIFSYPTLIAAKGDGDVVIFLAEDQNNLTNLVSFKSIDGGDVWFPGASATDYQESGEGFRYFTVVQDQNDRLHFVHNFSKSSVVKNFSYNVSDDWSNSWSPQVTISDTSYDQLQSKGNTYNSPSVAISSSGAIYAAWADKRFDPTGDLYNMFLTRSTDNGQSWEKEIVIADSMAGEGTGFPSMAVKSGANIDTVVLVWSEFRVITTLENEIKISADNFVLKQNYPNPFNPSTTINYQLKAKSDVKLTIYDITGREIKNLVSENQDIGQYSFNFDGQNIPSGVYFYTLKTNEFYQTRRMILLK